MPPADLPACGRLKSRERWLLGLLLVVMVALHIGTQIGLHRFGRALYGYDDQFYYATLRSVVFDHDIEYTNELHDLGPYPKLVADTPRLPTGYMSNKYGIGWAVVAAGPYLLTHGVLMLLSCLGVGGGWTGYEAPYQLAASLSHVTAGWLGIVATYKLMRRYVQTWPAMASTMLVLIGSPLLFYCIVYVGMAHACGFMAVAYFTYLAVTLAEDTTNRIPTAWWRWVAMGLLAVLMAMIRGSNIVFWIPAILPLYAIYHRTKTQPLQAYQTTRALLWIFLGALPLMAIQLAYWRILFGQFLPYTYDNETFYWLHPNLVGYLFSHRHGLFFFSPVCLLCVAGLIALIFSRDRRLYILRFLTIAGLLSGVVLVYVNSAWWCWWFGDGFGNRSFVEFSPFWMIGLAWLIGRLGRKLRLALLGTAALCIAWTLTLMLMQLSGGIAHDGSTTGLQIIANLVRNL
jgi:hypothetical protein